MLKLLKTAANKFVNYYVVWTLLSFVLGYYFPDAFAWFNDYNAWAMAIVMFCMGLATKVEDFVNVVVMPKPLLLGTFLKYLILPFWALVIAIILDLPEQILAGLILLACCPGATASNLMTFIARANVALSVILTGVSTMLAVVTTPVLCEIFAGRSVEFDGVKMALDILKIVAIPVSLGAFINWKFPKFAKGATQAGGVFSVLAICMISAAIIAKSSDSIMGNLTEVIIAVTLFNVGGLFSGYMIPKLLLKNVRDARTISIEMGMQNGGLAATLATSNFVGQPLVAIPAIFFAIISTLIGGICATHWRRQTEESESKLDQNQS